MTYSRYEERQKFKNRLEQFRELFEKRDVSYINQYVTPKFNDINTEEFSKIQIATHIWKAGDRLYKLSYEHYNSAELWWVIAWFNKKPTESHFTIGEKVYIPKPINKILELIGV